jgi:4-amino-4-deoxy-L-arabinose transferase-like glycosyltransferase
MLVPGWHSIYGFGLVVAVWAAGVALTTQGWRGRVPAFDLLTYIHSAHALLSNGALPEHGDVGSYGSFKPAGTAWLMVPSTLMLGDPRLSEYIGTAVLHLATIAGLFLLARKYFGARCAALAVIVYGLSEIGLFMAGSLWPNGRPDFFVWLVYLASEWVTRRDGRYLAGAFAVWGVGMQVDMALSPALFILPVLWLVYRPSVRVRPLLAAAVLVVVVWAPYLRFEIARDFVDVRSQLFFQSIVPPNFRDAWCDTTLTVRRLTDTAGATREGADSEFSRAEPASPAPDPEATAENPRGGGLERVETAVRDRLLSNFATVAPLPGASVVLLVAVFATIVLTTVPGARSERSRWAAFRGDKRRLAVAAAVLIVGLVSFTLARLVLGEGSASLVAQRVGQLGVLATVAFVGATLVGRVVDGLLTRREIRLQTPASADQRKLLALSLTVPWLLLVVAAEPGKPERFWWLWPLQVLFLAAFAVYFLPRLFPSRLLPWVVQGALVAVVVGNSFLVARVDAWVADGWSGRDAPEVEVVDYLAEQLADENRNKAAVGYHIFLYPFMAKYHIINPEYKVGAEFDVLLRYRHGIMNTNGCAEGLSPRDEFRLVRTRPMEPDWAPREYFDVPLDDTFRPIARFGEYEVFRRA